MTYIDEMPEEYSKRISDYNNKILKKFSTK